MSDTFSCVWSALLLACLLVLGHSTPITEESTVSRSDEKQWRDSSTTESAATSGTGLSTMNSTEDDHLNTLSREAANVHSKPEKAGSAMVPVNGEEMPEMEESKKENRKRDADDDDDSDSDYDDDDDDDDDGDDRDDRDDGENEREGIVMKTYPGVLHMAKRALVPEDSKVVSATEGDFVDHVLDYSLDRKKREEDPEMGGTRKERQSGETIPYILPNRSRRDEGSENEEAGQSGGRVEAEREEGEKEAEEVEEEENKEELEEKLEMES